MINAVIKTIPHGQQRLDGNCGDYWTDEKGIDQYRISKMPKMEYEYLVAIHELVENFCLKVKGIKEPDVQNFDEEYYKNLPKDCNIEAGDSVKAPYRNEHSIATAVERMLCGYLNIPWQEYDKAATGL
jgi:hypothetical protein